MIMAFFYLFNYFNILSIVTEKFNQLGIFGTFSYISLTEMKDMRMQWNIISLCWIMSLFLPCFNLEISNLIKLTIVASRETLDLEDWNLFLNKQ